MKKKILLSIIFSFLMVATGLQSLPETYIQQANEIILTCREKLAKIDSLAVKNPSIDRTPLYKRILDATHNFLGFERAPLHIATFIGDIRAIKTFVACRDDIDKVDASGMNSLMHAAIAGDEKMVKALIGLGASTDTVSINNFTPLFFAIQQGYPHLFKHLVYRIPDQEQDNFFKKVGAIKPDATQHSLDTTHDPLQFIIHHESLNFTGHNEKLDYIKKLLTLNININVPDDHGDTPLLQLARTETDIEIVEELLKSPQFVEMRNKKTNEHLLHIAASTNTDFFKRLFNALDSDSLDVYINAKTSTGITPLHCAVNAQRYKNVQLLLDHGADVDAVITSTEETALHLAVQNDDPRMIELLCTRGANPNLVKKDSKRSPLHLAVSLQHADCVDALIAYAPSLDLNASDHFTSTPLSLAGECNNYRIAQKLLEAGVNPNIPFQSKIKDYPIFQVIAEGKLEILDLLLNYKADPNVTDHSNDTPLHFAIHRAIGESAIEKILPLITTLIKHGAKLDLPNKWGKTAEEIITTNNQPKLLALLQKKDASVSATKSPPKSTKNGKIKKKRKTHVSTSPPKAQSVIDQTQTIDLDTIATTPEVEEVPYIEESPVVTEEKKNLMDFARSIVDGIINRADAKICDTRIKEHTAIATDLHQQLSNLQQQLNQEETSIDELKNHQRHLLCGLKSTLANTEHDTNLSASSSRKKIKADESTISFSDNPGIDEMRHAGRLFFVKNQFNLRSNPVFNQELRYVDDIKTRLTIIPKLVESGLEDSLIARQDTDGFSQIVLKNIGSRSITFNGQSLQEILSNPRVAQKLDLKHLYSPKVDRYLKKFGIVEKISIENTVLEVSIPGELVDNHGQIVIGFYQWGFNAHNECIHRCFRPYTDKTQFISPLLKKSLKPFIENNYNALADNEMREQAYQTCLEYLDQN